MDRSPQLHFRPDGTFHLMQVTDAQERLDFSPDTLKLLETALDREKPDLVVFTGDQIMGYGRCFRGPYRETKVRQAIQTLLRPLTERKIPFSVTFGNHDCQCGISNEEQLAIYRENPFYVPGIPGPTAGTACLPVLRSDSVNRAFAIYLLDSGGDAAGGGYEAPPSPVLAWYRRTRDRLADEQGGAPLPALVFQHIPLPEYYQVLQQVPKNTKGAVRAFRTHQNKWYRIPQSANRPDNRLGEPPSIPDQNTGEWELLAERGDVFGVFCGHDHKNSFVLPYRGMDLGYCPSCGFHVYGPGVARGVRTFVLREDAPRDYKTHVLTFRELCGSRVHQPVADFLYSRCPATKEDALHMLRNLFIGIAAVSASIFLLCWLL